MASEKRFVQFGIKGDLKMMTKKEKLRDAELNEIATRYFRGLAKTYKKHSHRKEWLRSAKIHAKMAKRLRKG